MPASPGFETLASLAPQPSTGCEALAPQPASGFRRTPWPVAKSIFGSASQNSRSDLVSLGAHGPPATGGGPYGVPADHPNDQPPSVGDLWQSRGDTMSNVIDELSGATRRDDVPDFRAGDTIKVHVKVVEGNRARLQVFQGVVIRLQGSGIARTFTVRKISFGVGVERTFPIHSPIFDSIEIVTRGDVRRAKLYYLRNLRGKAAKIKERREGLSLIHISEPTR